MTREWVFDTVRAMNTANTPPDTEEFDPAPRSGAELPVNPRARELAESLDCMLEADVCTLARVSPGTVENWRKRGTGPAYVQFGRQALYPKAALRQYLESVAAVTGRKARSDAKRGRAAVDRGPSLL